MRPGLVIISIWIGWAVSWVAAAGWSHRTESRPPIGPLSGTTVAKGTALGIAGFALLLIGIWMKARVEERWLTEELGADAYGSYRRRVPMLLPFGPTGA